MSDVDVMIPTLRRPDQLARALRSVFAQDDAPGLVSKIVVVDNSPEGSAVAMVETLRRASPVPLVYVHEPQPGVATARNAGVVACTSRFVAFLDDDEVAPAHWLRELRCAHLTLGSMVTFGPVHGVAEGAKQEFRPYLDRFFSRLAGDEDTLLPIAYGCGNSIMTRAAALAGPTPFDARHDMTGGEDDRLFDRLRADGATFGWASKAWVHEYAPLHRTRVTYALRRAFCYGQSPCQASVRKRDLLGLIRNMAIGVGQATVYGAISMAMFTLGRRSAGVTWLDRAVRGLGKVFWPIKVHFYGTAIPAPRHQISYQLQTAQNGVSSVIAHQAPPFL